MDLPWTVPEMQQRHTHTELSQTNDDSRVTLAFDVLVSTVRTVQMLFSVTIRFFVDKPHQAALANSVAAQLEDMQQQYSSLFNQTLLGISWLSLCTLLF